MKRLHKFGFFGLAMGILSLPFVGSGAEATTVIEEDNPVPVKTSLISLVDYQEYGEFYGTIEGFEEANLISHTGGEVRKLQAKSGQQVRRGQKLCDIDGDLIRVRNDSATLAEDIAKKDYDRILLHQKNGNASELQTSRTRLAWLQAKNSTLEANKAMESAFCESPIDGVITGVNIRQFENLSPGSPTISIAKIARVRMLVGVPESEASVYDRGRPVQVFLNSLPEKKWEGVLDNLALKINSQDKTFTAEVWVENPDLSLKPGLTAKARILKYNFKDKIVIPSSAVLVRDQKRIVMVVGKDGVARAKEVKILTSYDDRAVIDSGIKTGDQLIVKGQNQLVDGAKIRVIP